MSSPSPIAVPLSFDDKNVYQSDLMEVVQVRQQTSDVKSVRIRFC